MARVITIRSTHARGARQLPKPRRRMLRARRRHRFANLIVVYCLSFLTIFTIAMVFVFYRTGVEPTTLISCVFMVIGTELGVLMANRITEKVVGKKKEEPKDEDHLG